MRLSGGLEGCLDPEVLQQSLGDSQWVLCIYLSPATKCLSSSCQTTVDPSLNQHVPGMAGLGDRLVDHFGVSSVFGLCLILEPKSII